MIENEIGSSTKSKVAVFFALLVSTGVIIALPLVRARYGFHCAYSPRGDCVNHLRQIDGAKLQWALEKRKGTNDVPSVKDISPYIRPEMPKCAAGGSYTLGPVGESPRCSVTGHVLP